MENYFQWDIGQELKVYIILNLYFENLYWSIKSFYYEVEDF